MEELAQFKYLYTPFLLWFCIQLFKVIWDLVTTKQFNFKRIMGAGGMPSSHSAVVTSIAMYDAAGVRRAAGKQARLLNKIVNTPGLTNLQVQEKLVEVLGHTPMQVVVGAVIGIMAGLVL